MNADLLIKNLSRSITLDQSEIDYFLSYIEPVNFKRKELVQTAGDLCRHQNFIVKGCLRTFYIDKKGVEHILAFAIEDMWMTDLYSFLTKTPATLCVDALENSEILRIERSGLEKVCNKIPKFERLFRLILQRAFISQQERLMQHLSSTAEQRYIQFRKSFPGIEQRVPQKQIASFLGITPVFLSMLRRKTARYLLN
jgi:CRP-like cAMP-binding protein